MRKFKTLSHGDWKRQIATGTHAELTALLATIDDASRQCHRLSYARLSFVQQMADIRAELETRTPDPQLELEL